MRCPTLSELPSPPAGNLGWPWTEGSHPLPRTLPDGSSWPRITVVTPSYNQAPFIEETIRSVLLQEYPDLEYMIIDGGSTDGSVDIIRKYEPWLAYWVSEPDRGQAAAIQSGWQASTGEVLAFLNSDDAYLPAAVGTAVTTLSWRTKAPAVCGGELRISRDGHVLRVRQTSSTSLWQLLNLDFIPQPATFVRRVALERVGGLDTTFEYVFDFELWLRLAALGPIEAVPEVLAATRWHRQTKTQSRRCQIACELIRAIEKTVAESDRWSAEQRAQVLSRLHFLAASLFLEHPRYLMRAAQSWWSAFVHGPALRKRLFWLPVAKGKRYARRLLALGPWYSGASSGLHWSEWVQAQKRQGEVR